MVKPRIPRTRGSGKFTEQGYYTWLRSQLRRISQRWPPLYKCLDNHCRSATEEDKKRWSKQIKKVYQCSSCQGWFPRKFKKKTMINADHIVPCGSLKNDMDIGPFITRMLVEEDGLQPLCKGCHDQKTQVDKCRTL